ncbi:MAG: glucose 1-dehydrogenase [Nanoarchaeota archaeon]|nr:glucose 1-dehydrogenase [Nanoarchaeota archaeon]
MLENKVILITGSSRGIGAATAKLAREYGANVVLHGKTESDYLRGLASELNARYIYCDVADEREVSSKVSSLGKIDVLVNNAGINPSKTFMQLTDNDWHEIINTNILGVVNFSRAVIPGMLERGQGRIINMASVKGYNHVTAKPAYSTSKAAVMRMTSSMAQELAPKILVNAVAPGFTKTEMTESTLSPAIRTQIGRIPLKRMASPREIAEAILFLASDRSSYITGQILVVDGGFSIS